jgi:signal peptidase II
VSPKLRILLILTLVVVPLDQITKLWVTRSIPRGGAIPVIDGFFSITHVLNPGIVFGLFQGGYVGIFLLLTALAVGLIFMFYRQLPDGDLASATALGLILGGAVGNGIDRLVRQAVVDFLHFDFTWFVVPFTYPDFNVADSAIVVGVGILIFAPQTWTPPVGAPAAVPARGDAAASEDSV